MSESGGIGEGCGVHGSGIDRRVASPAQAAEAGPKRASVKKAEVARLHIVSTESDAKQSVQPVKLEHNILAIES
jgi:hypothetical protein